MQKIKFIINPSAGVNSTEKIPDLIGKLIDKSEFDHDIKFTEAPKHATELAHVAVNEGYDVVAVVGGDGSINEVATALVGTDTALAVIPSGSGNGLARYLNIPLKASEAIRLINTGRIKKIDVCSMNDHFFFNMAGVGFDGHVAHEFDKRHKRGFWSYFSCVIQNYFTYKANNYRIAIDNTEIEARAKLIAFANANQYGNNFVIAPEADIEDGLIDVYIIPTLAELLSFRSIVGFMVNRSYRNKKVGSIKGKHITVRCDNQEWAHIDGEPYRVEGLMEIDIDPLSLKVLVPGT